MGKNKKRGKGRKGQNPKGSGWQRSSLSIEELVHNGNYLMEAYYALQGLHNYRFVDGKLVECKDDQEKEEERLRWRNASTDVLPTSFRIGKDLPPFYRKQLATELETFAQDSANFKPEEGEPEIITPLVVTELPFLEYGYQLSLDRSTLRKHKAFKSLHRWLIDHDSEGHITRQETVSMLPPVLLDIQTTDKVLDMCAAPGSKTTQMLEDDPALLVANDANHNRAYMLVHQLRRIMYHHPSILVTNAQAQYFPSNLLQFDKILCDVPCTGDGTPRKNIDVWKKWNVLGAQSLHFVQLQIAKRGAFRLLKVGGTICYSTCSMNPIENEAVVAELIRSSEGALELVDCNEMLGSFHTRPGMSTWKVIFEDRPNCRDRKNKEKKNNPKMQARRKEFEQTNEDAGMAGDEPGAAMSTDTTEAKETVEAKEEPNSELTTIETKAADVKKEPVEVFKPDSWDETSLLADAAKRGLQYFESSKQVPEELISRLRPSMFPPTAAEAAAFHLERCVRCLSQDNNSGGFFVAILRKTGPMSSCDRKQAQTETPTKEPATKKAKVEGSSVDEPPDKKAADADSMSVDSDKQPKAKKGKALGSDGFEALGEGTLEPLIEFFGLSNGFDPSLFYTRTKGDGKVFHYIAPEVKALIDVGIQERVTVINTGLKAFAKNAKNSHCTIDKRACQEAAHILAPHMTKRKIFISISDFRRCLGCVAKACPLEEFSEEFSAQVKDIGTGSFIILLKGYEDKQREQLLAAMWKCRGDAVDGLVGKAEGASMLKKLASLESKEESEPK